MVSSRVGIVRSRIGGMAGSWIYDIRFYSGYYCKMKGWG